MSPGTSILKTCHYLDLSTASDWLKQISLAARPIRSTTLIWVMTRHQNGISALVSKTTFRGETSGGVATCRLFQALTKGRAQEQLYDNWQQNRSELHFFYHRLWDFVFAALLLVKKMLMKCWTPAKLTKTTNGQICSISSSPTFLLQGVEWPPSGTKQKDERLTFKSYTKH